MNEFLYLYRRPEALPGSPQQMQEIMQRWRAWFTRLQESGHLAVYGQPLEFKGGSVVSDARGGCSEGPYAETKDVVVGYSVVRAADLKEAITLTRGHPIFDQGGLIEVRPVQKM